MEDCPGKMQSRTKLIPDVPGRCLYWASFIVIPAVSGAKKIVKKVISKECETSVE
ncbi:hypothetical protein HPP92_026746 [Vanilla planifolia]|uniref:Uncharacterized protein n=1 Tax=Vanilla planifolia TaxID=51239 RepID=A0A835PB63_VANPL|nr:hypothetical protein HPP92_026746 [Vanilla planifolia]